MPKHVCVQGYTAWIQLSPWNSTMTSSTDKWSAGWHTSENLNLKCQTPFEASKICHRLDNFYQADFLCLQDVNIVIYAKTITCHCLRETRERPVARPWISNSNTVFLVMAHPESQIGGDRFSPFLHLTSQSFWVCLELPDVGASSGLFLLTL
jgi:hypothetical protein